LGPSYIREFFRLTTVEYNLRGIGTKLVLPNFNLEWVHKSFSYIVANLWNSLPVKIREVEGIDEFKKALRDYMFKYS